MRTTPYPPFTPGMTGKHKYTALQDANPLTKPDPQGITGEPIELRTNSQQKSTWKRWRWVFEVALLMIILALFLERVCTASIHNSAHRYEITGDVTGFAPQFSRRVVTFQPDPIFVPDNASAFWDQETQLAWLDLVPKGLGFVQVKKPSVYDHLPTPIRDYPNDTVFTTSMTHQLHCLHTILDAYNILTVTRDPSLIELPFHITHCFDYLRQAIMCAGDVALEGAATTFPPDPVHGDRGGSDGWDAKHICKDYAQIYEYLERETINPSKWIS